MKLRFILEVDYNLDGTTPSILEGMVKRGIKNFIDEGGLSGYTDATVNSWSLNVEQIAVTEEISPPAAAT